MSSFRKTIKTYRNNQTKFKFLKDSQEKSRVRMSNI